MPIEYRVLSLWQPWASLIAWGLKRYETRSWATNYRGRLAIAATKTQPVDIKAQIIRIGYEAANDPYLGEFVDWVTSHPDEVPQGCIIAVAGKMECFPTGYLLSTIDPIERACGDWSEGRHAFKLVDSRPTHPIPWVGGQGFRIVKDEAIRSQLDEILNPTITPRPRLANNTDPIPL
jgi:activating signal cointegrator 1